MTRIAALRQTFRHAIETGAAAIENNVVEYRCRQTRKMSPTTEARFDWPSLIFAMSRLGQAGKAMRRQRRKVQALGRFRDKREGQRFSRQQVLQMDRGTCRACRHNCRR